MKNITELELDALLHPFDDFISSSYRGQKINLFQGVTFRFDLEKLMFYYKRLPNFPHRFICYPENTRTNLRDLIQYDYYNNNYLNKYILYSEDVVEISIALDNTTLIKDKVKVDANCLKRTLLKYYFELNLKIKSNFLKLLRGSVFEIKIKLIEESSCRLEIEKDSNILNSELFLEKSFEKFLQSMYFYQDILQEATNSKLINKNEGVHCNIQLSPIQEASYIVLLWNTIHSNRKFVEKVKSPTQIYQDVDKRYNSLVDRINASQLDNSELSFQKKSFFSKWIDILLFFIGR